MDLGAIFQFGQTLLVSHSLLVEVAEQSEGESAAKARRALAEFDRLRPEYEALVRRVSQWVTSNPPFHPRVDNFCQDSRSAILLLQSVLTEYEKPGQGPKAGSGELMALVDLLRIQPTVVRNAADWAMLEKWKIEGNFKEIDAWLRDESYRIVSHWKSKLGIRSGRPLDKAKRKMYMNAALLKTQGKLSWAQVALKVDPAGFKQDRQKCVNRVRSGVRAILKAQMPDNPQQ